MLKIVKYNRKSSLSNFYVFVLVPSTIISNAGKRILIIWIFDNFAIFKIIINNLAVENVSMFNQSARKVKEKCEYRVHGQNSINQHRLRKFPLNRNGNDWQGTTEKQKRNQHETSCEIIDEISFVVGTDRRMSQKLVTERKSSGVKNVNSSMKRELFSHN